MFRMSFRPLAVATAALACLLSPMDTRAANYEEISALRAQMAEATLAVAELSGQAQTLQQSLDILNRKQAGKPDETGIASRRDDLLKERNGINSSVATLSALKATMDTDKEAVRNSYMELKGYVERLDKLQTQNLVKTTIALAMETAQEIEAFTSLPSKPVEIVKWTAEKIADPAIKAIVSYGGPDYYTRQIQGLSGKASSVIPEMQRLSDLAGLSLDGWRSYMVKYEDKTFEGSNGLILGKVRVLLEQSEKARWALVDLYNQLDRESQGMGVDMDNLKDRAREIDQEISDLEKQEKTAQSDIFKTLASQQATLAQELSDVRSKLDAAKQKLSTLQDTLKDKLGEQDASPIENQVATYKALRERLNGHLPGYEAQADALDQAADAALESYAGIPEEARRQQKEMDAVVAWTLENATYPYPADGMTDKTALENSRKYQDNWMQTREQQLAENLVTANRMAGLADGLEKQLNATPHDPSSERILRNAISAAGPTIYDALTKTLRTTYDSNGGTTNSTTQRLEKLKADMKALLNTPLPKSPYARNKSTAQENITLSDDLESFTRTLILHLRNYATSKRASLQEEGRFLDNQKKEQAKTLETYSKEIAAREETYRHAAQTFLVQGADYLSRINDLIKAQTAYTAFLSAQVQSGLITGTTSNGYQISQTWISKTLKDTSMTCPAIQKLQDALSPSVARSNRLFSDLGAAQQLAKAGASSAPLSDWAKTNQPSLYANVLALNGKIEQARQARNQLEAPPLQDPFTTFSNNLGSSNAFMATSVPALNDQLLKNARDLMALVKIAIQEATHDNAADRISEVEVQKMRDWVRQLQTRQQTEFGCFEDTHAFNKDLLPKLGELSTLVKKLDGKSTYLDAGTAIRQLETLLDEAQKQEISRDDAYKNAVTNMMGRLETSKTVFMKNESKYAPSDASRIRQLLHDVEEALQVHAAELLDMDRAQGQISNAQIQTLYQNFINAYGSRDLHALLALLGPDWQGGDGADTRDVEEYLSNSFRVFDKIEYRISGFSAKPLGDGSAQVSYAVKISGENRRQRLTHEEESQIVELVGLVDGQARILRTISGNQWLR